jgi:hypothetical protein
MPAGKAGTTGAKAGSKPGLGKPAGGTPRALAAPPPPAGMVGIVAPGQQCTQCGATQTPVWRLGPAGPKTLCNACGVRYMKAVRAQQAAAAGAGGKG